MQCFKLPLEITKFIQYNILCFVEKQNNPCSMPQFSIESILLGSFPISLTRRDQRFISSWLKLNGAIRGKSVICPSSRNYFYVPTVK